MAFVIDIDAIDAWVRELGFRPTRRVYFSYARDQVIVQMSGYWVGFGSEIFTHIDGEPHWKPVVAAELGHQASARSS